MLPRRVALHNRGSVLFDDLCAYIHAVWLNMYKKTYTTRWLVVGIVVLCVIGAWVSGNLVKQHANLWTHTPGSESSLFGRICQASAAIGLDCSGTLKSGWSELTVPVPLPTRSLGVSIRYVTVPVAFAGLAYFVFMGVWFASIGGPRPYGVPWHRVPLQLGYAGLVLSLFYISVMAAGLAPWCLWCMTVHAINFLLVFTVWRLCSERVLPGGGATAGRDTTQQDKARLTLTTREVVSAAAFAAIIISGLWGYRRERLMLQHEIDKVLPYKVMVTSFQRDPEFLLREFYAQTQHSIPLRESEVVHAEHPRLVVFTDFECPACYCNAQFVKDQLVGVFGGRLSVLVRHYPLCMDCNESVNATLHPEACHAAYAAEAARLQGGETAFERMHHLLFKNRRVLGEETYRRLATQIGLDADQLVRDMRSERVVQLIQADTELARDLGVKGTPTMFLDGRRVGSLYQTPVFWQAFASQHAPPSAVADVSHSKRQTDLNQLAE